MAAAQRGPACPRRPRPSEEADEEAGSLGRTSTPCSGAEQLFGEEKKQATKPQNPGISNFFYFPGVRSGVSGVVRAGALCLCSLLFVVPFLAELSIFIFFKVF